MIHPCYPFIEESAMLRLEVAQGSKHCDGMTRREWLRVGAIGACSISLPGLLRLEASANTPRRVRARSVIMLFLNGGPSHLDMFDLKPEAPEEIRGTFRPIATRVNGIQISE